jgi:hypothetical protein
VFVTDGTYVLTGNAGGDLCLTYPNPLVCGVLGSRLPSINTRQPGSGIFWNSAESKWEWKIPLFFFPPATGDISGTYPSLTVTGWSGRPLDPVSMGAPAVGDVPRYRGGRWVSEPYAATAPRVTSAMTFNLCLGVECSVSSNIANPYIVTSTNLTISRCYISARIPPTTQNLIVDILKNGLSILGSSNASKLNLTPSGGLESVVLANVAAVETDIFTVNIIQTGSGFKGQDVTVACKIQSQEQ